MCNVITASPQSPSDRKENLGSGDVRAYFIDGDVTYQIRIENKEGIEM